MINHDEELSRPASQDGLSIGILTGGKSRRMGQNKAFLTWNDQSFIEHITGELSGFAEVLVSCREPELYRGLELPLVVDERDDIGPLEGIRCLLKKASCESIFICAVDMPLVTEELVRFLWKKKDPESDCLAVQTRKQPEPLCAVYSKRVLPVIETMLSEGEHRLYALLERITTQTVHPEEGDFGEEVVRNLNFYEDYEDCVNNCLNQEE